MPYHFSLVYSRENNPKGVFMPTIGNIVIKKADGTTDVTYTALQAAGGDKLAARWASKTVGGTPAENPKFTCSAESNGPDSARRVKGSFLWPKTRVDSAGNTIVNGGANGTYNVLIPQDMSSAEIQEIAYQFGNLVASTLIKQSMAEGYAPRSS